MSKSCLSWQTHFIQFNISEKNLVILVRNAVRSKYFRPKIFVFKLLVLFMGASPWPFLRAWAHPRTFFFHFSLHRFMERQSSFFRCIGCRYRKSSERFGGIPDPRRIKPNKHVETADLGLFKTRFSIIYRHRRVGRVLIDAIPPLDGLSSFILCGHVTTILIFYVCVKRRNN